MRHSRFAKDLGASCIAKRHFSKTWAERTVKWCVCAWCVWFRNEKSHAWFWFSPMKPTDTSLTSTRRSHMIPYGKKSWASCMWTRIDKRISLHVKQHPGDYDFEIPYVRAPIYSSCPSHMDGLAFFAAHNLWALCLVWNRSWKKRRKTKESCLSHLAYRSYSVYSRQGHVI